jgi:hypothetical protein
MAEAEPAWCFRQDIHHGSSGVERCSRDQDDDINGLAGAQLRIGDLDLSPWQDG